MVVRATKFQFASLPLLKKGRKLLRKVVKADQLACDEREVPHGVDAALLTIAVDTSTEKGQSLADILTSLLTSELGTNSFQTKALGQEGQP